MPGQYVALLAFGFIVFIVVLLVLVEWFTRYIKRAAPEMRKRKYPKGS